MGLEERVEKLAGWGENAPWPVKYAVKTAGTIAFTFAWAGSVVYAPLISLLPEKVSVKLLGVKDAISNTKKTSLLEGGLAVADLGYRLFTGDHFLPPDLSYYLLADGLWRYQRASTGWQQFYNDFTFLPKRKPEPRGTLALELPAAVVERLLF